MTPVVTGVGTVTALGATARATWNAILAGQSASRVWPDLADFRVATACRVDGLGDTLDRGRALAVEAARQALDGSATRDVGVYVGTTLGESARFEAAAAGAALDLGHAGAAAWPAMLAEHFGLKGPRLAFGCACAAGNYAIGLAAAAVARGEVRAALAGGVEPFSRIAQVGFSRIRAMDPEQCRPFDQRRGGMQLGEGAAFVLIERADDVAARGSRGLAVVGALGLCCEADHPTSPNADGAGMAEAMERSLARQALRSGDIDAVCAHGSGTQASDAAEALAIARVFPHRPPVFGVKGALGHSMGAAAAIEAVMSVLAIQDGVLPPTVGHRTLAEGMEIDVTAGPRRCAPRWIMSTAFAFGGLDSALLIGRCP